MRNASDRLLNLLQVLVERFGRRTSDGFVMPLGFPRFGGHRSGIHVSECTSSHELLLVINRAEVAQR